MAAEEPAADEQAPQPVVSFRKKAGKNSNARIRPRPKDGEEDVEEDHLGVKLDVLADIVAEQKARRRIKGMGVANLAGIGKGKASAGPLQIKGKGVDGQDAPKEPAFGLQDGVQANTSLQQMIESQFMTSGAMGAAGGEVQHEKLMEEYVKKQLGLGQEEEEAPKKKGMTEEDRLYIIPEDFKKKVQQYKSEVATPDPSLSKLIDGEIGDGAQIAWNTGLAEVALPIEYKLKNIENTKKAKDAFDQQRQQRERTGESHLMGSVTANYQHHQRERALMIREKQERQERANGNAPVAREAGPAGPNVSGERPAGEMEAPSNRPKGRDASSDTAVYERFKKRARRFG